MKKQLDPEVMRDDTRQLAFWLILIFTLNILRIVFFGG